jgi:hypothetical protein
MYVLILTNLYTILKNTYIQFEEYDIGYVCTQYIQLEKYGASMGMNDDERTSVDGCWWTEGAGWTKLNDEHQTKTNGRRTELTDDGIDRMVMDGDRR